LIRRVENEKSELLSGNALGFAVWEFLDLGHGVDDAGSTLGLWHVFHLLFQCDASGAKVNFAPCKPVILSP
jgi:hypothetical protein